MRRSFSFPVLIFILSFLAANLSAQRNSWRVTTPSPTAASLGKFGDVPVSLYTGTPTITIPLFTAKGRTLELPIALRYHAGGNKVEEIGSWVGIGWTLDAGGTITRTVRGLFDENLGRGYYYTGQTWYDPEHWPNLSATALNNLRDEYIDGEPDQFFFNFAGRSGQFALGPTSMSGPVEYRVIPHQRLRIEPSFMENKIVQWTITTEDGTQYVFGQPETTTDRTTTSSTQESTHWLEQYTSSWHLTNIIAPGGDDISLEYAVYTTVHAMGSSRERFDHVQVNQGEPCVQSVFDVWPVNEIATARLVSITTAAHSITFTPGALRTDATSPQGVLQEPTLDKLTVWSPTGTVLRVFQFAYNYSTGRLTLASVVEQDRAGDSLPPYIFTYDPMPLPNRSSFAVDHWGFYNGRTTNTTLIPQMVGPFGQMLSGANREPDAAYARAGILTKITFPTGGANEFFYELNDYASVGTTPVVGIADGPEQYAEAYAGPDAQVVTQEFTLSSPVSNDSILVSLNFFQDPTGCAGMDDPPCPMTELLGSGGWQENGQFNVLLPPGTYTLQASTFAWNQQAGITATWRNRVTTPGRLGAGMRIAEIRTSDGMGNSAAQKYRYRLASDTTRSSGVVNNAPRYDYQYYSPTCAYFSRSSMSRMPLGDGPVVAYRDVTVSHGANGQFGKTRHTFRSPFDTSDYVPVGPWPFSRRTSNEWQRGQELGVQEYDSSGRAQQRIASTYVFDDGPVARRFRGMSINSFSAGLAGSNYVFNSFEVVSAWAYSNGDTTVIFDETGSNSFTSARRYVYGNPTHLQLTQRTEINSNGTGRITRMKYPADYASGTGDVEAAALTEMQGPKHIHTPVIERWVAESIGGSVSVLQAGVTTFKQYAAGQYLPYQSFALNSPSGVTNFAISSVTGGVFTKDNRYLLQETANTYDAYGRIFQLTDPRGKVITYAYGGSPYSAFLTKITRIHDAGGANLVTDIAYDPDGFVSSIKDEAGGLRYFTYDLFGCLRQVQNNAGTPVRAYGYTYSRASPSWTFNPNTPNAIVDSSFVQPSQALVSTSYIDGLGRPIQSVIRDGTNYHVTATQYDLMGRVWRTWKPYTRTTAGYDPSFTTSATTSYNTYHSSSTAKPYAETSYTPDALGRVKRMRPEYLGTTPTDSLFHAYGLDVIANHEYTEVTDESGKKRRNFTDLFGNAVRTILGYGTAEATNTTHAYNVLGQRTQTTDPRGLVTAYTLNTRGLLTAKTSPDAGTVQHKYDQAGNLRYSQDANQAAAGTVLFTTYDFAGRPLVSGQAAATFSALDPFSSQTFESTTGNWVLVRQYDAKPTNVFPWSSFWIQISPLTLSNVGGRPAAVAAQSNGAWQVTLFSYDADGRVAKRYTYTQPNGGATVLTAVNTADTLTRDLRDAVTWRQVTVGSSGFYYWYDYDNRGLLWKVYASPTSTKPASPDVTYTYRPSGQLQDRQFAGGPLVPLRYTIREHLEKIGDPAASPNPYPFAARYAYHPNGTVSEAEFYNAGSPATAKRYRYVFGTAGYDALNRLKSADFSSYSAGWQITAAHDLANIAYDVAGNITALQRYRETATLIDNLTYSYPGTSNRLSSVSDAAGATAETWDAETGAFTYDANGNLKTAPAPYGITAVTYDHQNLALALTSNSVTSVYRYNEAGQRITKQVGTGNTEVYLLDGMTALGVFTVDGSGGVVSSYFNVLAGDKVVGRQPGTGNRRYYHTDLLGSTRAVVEGATVVESYDFEPWGLLMPGRTLAGPTKEGFTGKEQDAETGLDYFGARYYMPALARWTSVDPDAAKAPFFSSYAYAFDDPVSYFDPDGEFPIKVQVRSFAPFDRFGGIFRGDGASRRFHTGAGTSRIRQWMDIETDGMQLTNVGQRGSYSRDVVGREAWSPAYGSAELERTTDGNGHLQAHLWGDNVLSPSSDIDVRTTLSLSVSTAGADGSQILSIGGTLTGDNFPAAEAFVTDAGGASVFLGVAPLKGDVSMLIGDNQRPMATVNVKIAVDAQGRFTGVISGNKTISIREWNSQFERIDPK